MRPARYSGLMCGSVQRAALKTHDFQDVSRTMNHRAIIRFTCRVRDKEIDRTMVAYTPSERSDLNK
jgi:hypothetical protein